MASLPSQHPSLAIHMTDRATTPLISSAVLTSSSSTAHSPSQRQLHHSKQRKRQHPAFSTSPPSSATPSPSSTPPSANPDAADDADSDDEDEEEEDEPPISPASKQAKALTTLSATALLSYDAAKRLGRGAPLRTMVEYPDAGPVVLHSYMCPMGLALGVPGRRNGSSGSLHTSAGAVGSAGGSVNGGDDGGHDDDGGGGIDAGRVEGARDGGHRRRPARPLSFGLDPVGGGDEGTTDMEGIDPSDPPMLTSTVVAPRAEDLREARRATARLEKVARVFQAEWVSTGRR
ncbi:hypothetical protein F5883DRAFT_547559 [Diaporthe sp. PMI_573]|nr:hypothetical protein F5883DRAFT_547559 [Diaporthaceae sp. PMI_573]